MSISRLDINSALDRLMLLNDEGNLIALPFLPGSTSTAGTGVPTDSQPGFAPGALFFNVKGTTGTTLYVNTGTKASSTWLNIDGTLATAAAFGTSFANATIGVAAGYKIARGTTALDGSNPTPVTTGLATVVSAMVTLEGSAAPGVGTSVLTQATTNWATGALAVYAWKVTGSGDATLIASTGTETFDWIAVGT